MDTLFVELCQNISGIKGLLYIIIFLIAGCLGFLAGIAINEARK